MIPAIIFAQVWGVVELLVLTSHARTVRARTVFAAMAAGFYLIGPLTAFIQLSWIHLAAPMFGLSPSEMRDIASYTADPFIEEAMKLVPLLILLLLPAIRRQWSISDFVLVAAATGSGFGLTEHMFRFAADANRAQAVSGGWVIFVGASNALVPGFFRTVTSWLNNGVFFNENLTSINWHLAWSALGGLAVGLIVRKRTRAAILSAIGILLFIGVDHAYDNVLVREVRHSWLAWLSGPLHFFTVLLGVLVFAAVVAAWWLDEPLRRATIEGVPLLAAEQAAKSRLVGTMTASLSKLPWSLPLVAGFDRERRAFHAAHIAEVEGREAMFAALAAKRDRIDRELAHPGRPPLVPAWVNKSSIQTMIRRALMRPPVIIWLIVTAPPFLFLIIGGSPATAWLQRLLTGPLIWQLVLLITIAGQARVAWGVYGGVRKLPAAMRLPLGDDAAMLGLKLACGVGAVALGGFSIARVLGGVGATDHLLSTHASDAAKDITASIGANIGGSINSLTGPSPSGSPGGDAGSGTSGSSGSGAGSSSGSSDSDNGNQMSTSSGRSGGSSSSSNESDSFEHGVYGPGDTSWFLPSQPASNPGEASTQATPPGTGDSPLERAIYGPGDTQWVATSPPVPPTVNVNDLPDAPPVSVNDLPDAPVNVNDLPDAPPQAPPAPPKLSPQDLADQAAQKAADAKQIADDAQQASIDAQNAEESAWINSKTADPASDPDVADAQARVRAAHDAQDTPSKDADPQDPWDANKNKEAADAAKQEAMDAEQARNDAQNAFQKQQDANAQAAEDAEKQANSDAAQAAQDAAAAQQAAATAQDNANAAAAKAASDAARAADPAQAKADDAAKAASDAQKRADEEFYDTKDIDGSKYHDANAAAIAARAKAEAAQAAADAAHAANNPNFPPHKKG